VDRLLLAGLCTLEAAGVYQIAFACGSALGMAVTAFRDAYNPCFFERLGEPDLDKARLTAALPLSVGVFSAAGFAGSCFAADVLAAITSPAYHRAALFVPFIVSSVVFQLIYYQLVGVLFAKNMTRTVAVISVTTNVVSAFAAYGLVAHFGIWGAGISAVVSSALLTCTVTAVAQSVRPLPWALVRAAVLAAMPLLSLLFLVPFETGSPLKTVHVRALAVAVYALLCVAAVRPELRLFRITPKPGWAIWTKRF
jgi:O-antigen/teichoic acid export membrane protein